MTAAFSSGFKEYDLFEKTEEIVAELASDDKCLVKPQPLRPQIFAANDGGQKQKKKKKEAATGIGFLSLTILEDPEDSTWTDTLSTTLANCGHRGMM